MGDSILGYGSAANHAANNIIGGISDSIMCWKTRAKEAEKKLQEQKISINSLHFLQAAKWILIHERRRHLVDIAGIDIDLENLKNIEIPAEAMELIDYHFEIPTISDGKQ